MTINILCHLNTWISRLYHVEATLPLMIWVNDNFYFLFHIYNNLTNFFYNAQSLSVIIMSGHRLFSAKSTKGSEFWNNHYGHAYILLVIVSAVLAIPNIVFGFSNPDYYDRNKCIFVASPVDENLANLSNTIFLIKSFVFFVTILVINVWTIVLIRKRFAHKSDSPKVRTMMKNLTTIALINTLLFFFVLLYPVGLSMAFNVSADMKYNFTMITSDVLSLSLPYILLFCDRNVQTTLFKLKEKVSPDTIEVKPNGTSETRRKTTIAFT
ncbi:hypothetical protein GCK72_018920 [Caenorhabditis remanei]|uniref:Serpentine receptor class gamma n=1 Tax=Caenorhabditis remanei TaxID=31234 RepID=A0A6A5GBY2_CAERE|nr:hypothetical protein GCK72_018920 [Caenorhabditis remanei]KAF1752366.1 hypothetical protein GCK72_018920 [Caenorhabditis remanei]